MTSIVGIDEAGRGPLIGPLVIAGVLTSDEQKLHDLGARDSKDLTPLQRERMFDRILEAVDAYEIIVVTPQEIDWAVDSKTTNLNWLEADKSIEIVKKLKPEKAIFDCPSNNPAKYKAYVKKDLPDTQLVVEHKADANYPSVAAASILAKVTRDRAIEDLKKKIGMQFGSGYPSDPMTQGFLKKHYNDFPDIFRKSWASYKKVAGTPGQKSLGDF